MHNAASFNSEFQIRKDESSFDAYLVINIVKSQNGLSLGTCSGKNCENPFLPKTCD